MRILETSVFRIFRTVALTVLLGYAVICIWLYLAQQSLLFHPRPIAVNAALPFMLKHEEVFLDAPDGARLHGVLFHADSPTAVILHFHGNAENILDMEGQASRFTEMGYSFLAMDYRTYGKSSGSLSEAALFADATLFFDYLREAGWAESDIVISGRSIGTAIATELASRTSPRALVLYSGFASIMDLASEQFPLFPIRFLLKYPLDSATHMKSVNCPVLMLHGKHDSTVPLYHAQKLAAIRGKLLVFDNGDHNNLMAFPEFWQAFAGIINQ